MRKQPRQWYRIQALADGLTADIHVYDEIGPSFCGEPTVSASSFVAELDALPASVKTIRVHVNSPGGDVFDAITIANRLKAQREEKGRTVEVLIEGVAASAATIITCAGGPIRMADNALMMIHNPKAGGRGSAAEMRKMADMLDRVRSSIIATYQWVSAKTTEELGAMLDAETWMDAAECVASGFAHEVLAGVQVTASLRESSVDRLGEIPEALRPRVEALIARPDDQAAPPPAAPPSPPVPVPVMALTREALAAEAPQLVEALLVEGKTVGLAEGTAAERERIRALEQKALPGHGGILAAAKFGRPAAEGQTAVDPMSPEAFCVALVEAERGQRGRYLQDAAADSAEATVRGGAAPVAHDDTAQAEHKARAIAAGGNARRGGTNR